MRLLKADEKIVYDTVMSMIKVKKLRCWNKKAPEGFDKA